jgi:hypothetical protein
MHSHAKLGAASSDLGIYWGYMPAWCIYKKSFFIIISLYHYSKWTEQRDYFFVTCYAFLLLVSEDYILLTEDHILVTGDGILVTGDRILLLGDHIVVTRE